MSVADSDAVIAFSYKYPTMYKNYLDKGYKITEILPEDREPMQPCMCGSSKFIYMISNVNVFARCLECGRYNPMSPKIGKDPRKTKQYYRFLEGVRERYGYRCAFCRKPANSTKLIVHHIIPFSACDELRYCKNNGILLCKDCHKLIHKCMKSVNWLEKLELSKEIL